VARPLGCDAIEDARGVAIADLNDDGLLDIVINNNNAQPVIYLNRQTGIGNWLRMQLVAGPKSNRDGIGARVQLLLDTDGKQRKLTRWVEAGTGYAAQSDMRLHFGLAKAERVAQMRVRWPDGSSEEFSTENLAGRINSTIHIEQGQGIRDSSDGIVTDVANQTAAQGGR
jgi:enediyne biosynthesis protein E4